MARASSPLGKGMKIGKSLLGKAALGIATGGSSLLVQGGAMALKSRAMKAVAKGAGKLAARGGKLAGKGLAKVGSAAKRSKVGILARRGMTSAGNSGRARGRALRAKAMGWNDKANMAGHQGARRAANFAARKTNGRFGTARVANNIEDNLVNYRDRTADRRDVRNMRDDWAGDRDRQRQADLQMEETRRQADKENKARKAAAERQKWRDNHPS